jgi:peroxiredoxin
MLAAGDHAPAFSLPDLNGSQHSLKEMLQGGPVLVALYKVSCPVCHLALPYLQRISGGGLQIVAVSQDDAAPTALFMKTFGVRILTLLDAYESGYPVSNAFGVDQVPSLFLVETDGVISFAGSGFRKTEFEALAMRAGSRMFQPEESVPAWKPGCGAKN